MIETLASSAELALQPRSETSDGQRTVACPEVAAGELRCFKLLNPDPRTAWDFWYMLIVQRLGPIAKVTVLVPLADGGYRQLVTRTGHTELTRTESIETFEAESMGLGLIRLDELKVRKSYREIRERLFRIETTVQDFDFRGRPVSSPRNTVAPSWPHLPGEAEPDERARSAAAAERFGSHAVLHFPTIVPIGDDYEVADGELLPPADLSARTAVVRPGLRLEVSQRLGVPAAIVNDYYLIEESGRPRRLYGDRCVQKTRIRMVEIVKTKSDSGFFSSRTKITVIRRELRLDELIWEET